MVDVLFATNRAFVSGDPVASFASGRADPAGNLFCGVATVDEIDISKSGSGEITNTDQLVTGNFTAQHQSRIIGSNRDVLVFVHGAANSFADAVTRAAYNQTWLAASGSANSVFDVIAFSWPSRPYVIANVLGDLVDYYADQQAASRSAAQFANFLNQIAALRSEIDQQPGRRRRMNLLCHSMGNFMLAGALPTFMQISNTPNVVFDDIVLAAADEVDSTFLTPNGGRLAQVARLGSKTTVYFARDDMAMALSHLANHNVRVGYNGPSNGADASFFKPNVFELADCTNVRDYISDDPDRSHQYYRQSPTVRQDIVACLAGDTPTRKGFTQPRNVFNLF
jgi:esterase/lipase superfamily enzyme